jgi:tetratricopeptide (TPR) repeat protein
MWWNTLGAARYRAGDWTASVQALMKSMELHDGGDSFDWFLVAMACWQMKQEDLAREWFNAAQTWMERHKAKNEELLRFRSEAAALLKMPERSSSKTPPGSDEPTAVYALVLKTDPGAVWAYSKRGGVYAVQKQFEKAAADFQKVVDSGSDDVEGVWYPLALLQLKAGRTAEYQGLCTQLLKRLRQSDEQGLVRMTIVICKLGPQAGANGAKVVEMADTIVKKSPNNFEVVGIFGECLYRKGDFRAAIEQLDKSAHSDAGIGIHWRHLFLAMSHHQLGHQAQAETCLRQATDWIEKNASEKPAPGAELTTPLPWTLRLDLRLLRQEAEKLVLPAERQPAS